jgi:hypothetical protein
VSPACLDQVLSFSIPHNKLKIKGLLSPVYLSSASVLAEGRRVSQIRRSTAYIYASDTDAT